ncbi:MAG: hypothetical protein PUE08_08470 [Eubacteriales bacterium]|nr:hypothetical protein [Eubacteriales bacterium]
MKKLLTKIICTVLAVVMVFSCTTVAFAGNTVTPVVIVHGLGGSPIYKNPQSDSRELLGSFDIGSLFTSNKDAVDLVVDAAYGKLDDPAKLIKAAARIMGDYAEMGCDKNGNPLPDTGIANYWTDSLANHTDFLQSETSSEPALCRAICDKIGAQNAYAFNYDWRIDAYETGEKLDEFIELVKNQTGKSKVTLIGASEGTDIISAYIDSHKNDNEVEKVVFLNGAFNGVGVCRLFAMDFVLDKKVIQSYIKNVTTTMRNKDFDMTRLTWLADSAGDTIENVCVLFNKIVNDPELLKMLYNEALYPILGSIPAYWEFIPYNVYDTAVEKTSAIGFLDKSSGLFSKIQRYHGIQGRLVSNIAELKNKGVQIAIVANYGLPAVPVTSDCYTQSDALIETKYASLGATTANVGKTLPLSKTSKNKYASPDEIIDASTCAFPDNTWFFKGVQHVAYWYGSQACNFIAELVTTDAPLTISSIKSLTGKTQFIGTDDNLNFAELTTKNPKTPKISKLKKGSKSFKITVGKVSSISGYQIQYSTSSKFYKSKTKTVNLSSKSTSKTIKKLKKNKKYYVRVRTYKVVANKKVYSSWSTVKTVTTKK